MRIGSLFPLFPFSSFRRVAIAKAPFAAIVGSAAIVGCGNGDTSDHLLRQPDASVNDGGSDASTARDSASDADDAGSDPSLGGPCVDDGQCDDGLACTYDRCDTNVLRCRYLADDAQCSDGVYCNGTEVCVLGRGCAAGPVVACDDGNTCTIDRCIEADDSCEHAPRDADGDGDPDDRCVAMADCNDGDPRISSKTSEICDNGMDDDCDGAIDEPDCKRPQGDTCSAPIVLSTTGNFRLETAAARRDIASSCDLPNEASARDVALRFTVPAGSAPQDVDVWAAAGTNVGVAIQSACGAPLNDLACNAYGSSTYTRTRARGLGPGDYFVIVATGREAPVDLKLEMTPAEPRATNETCGTAKPVPTDTSVAVSIVDAAKDLESNCPSFTGELVYSISLATTRDLRIDARTTRGQGSPIVSFRSAGCSLEADELRCKSSYAASSSMLVRSVEPGTYYVTVAATAPADIDLVVGSAAPTSPAPDEACDTAPPIPLNETTTVSLRDHNDGIADGCSPGTPSAAYDLDLAGASDVLVLGRFSQLGVGALSLGTPTCAPSDRLACASSATPVRLSKRNVSPGGYRIGVFDSLGNQALVTPLVRPTMPPVNVGLSDTCAMAFELPATGGYFVGDTSIANASTNPPCDDQSNPLGGAPEQVLHFALPARSRVVFDMQGSSFTTILDVREGATCPGAAIPDACFIGFAAARSFLDIVLDAGDHWIVVDGFNGTKGPWSLDVRVLPPP